MWPGFKSWRQHHTWVKSFVGSLLCSEWCFFLVLWISPLLKNQHFLIPIHLWMASTKTKNHLKLWMCYTVPQNHYLCYLFIYLLKCLRRINFNKLLSVFQTSQLCKTYTFSSFLFCSWSEGRGPHCGTDNGLWMIKRKIAELKHSKRITVLTVILLFGLKDLKIFETLNSIFWILHS